MILADTGFPSLIDESKGDEITSEWNDRILNIWDRSLFHPSKDQAKLAKAGWRIIERRKVGCMWIVLA
jgi:hypothetical protein